MSNDIRRILATFDSNVHSVRQLVDFDHTVLDAAITNIDSLRADLDSRNPSIADRVANTVQSLRHIRDHDSMRKHYSTIYNQCIVLLVSHFSSALHSLFTVAAPSRVGLTAEKDALREELRFSLGELNDLNFELRQKIGDLLVTKRDISFQDMQSTVKAFKNYLGVEIPRDDDMRNIILAQAARHAIVHSGAVADARLVRQLLGIVPRAVKPVLNEGQVLAFSPEEVETVASSMISVVSKVGTMLDL